MSGLDYFKKFLDEEGYKYTINNENVVFKFQGVQFIAFNNSDSIYLQLVIVFYDVTDENRAQLLEVCNTMNKEKFMVKFTVEGDSIMCNLEFIPNECITNEDFTNYLEAMCINYMEFYDQVK